MANKKDIRGHDCTGFDDCGVCKLLEACNHKSMRQGPWSRYLYCTECGTKWVQYRDGHHGTTWELTTEKVDLIRKEVVTPNDATVPSQGAQGRRLSRNGN